jgi:hypothetical protein
MGAQLYVPGPPGIFGDGGQLFAPARGPKTFSFVDIFNRADSSTIADPPNFPWLSEVGAPPPYDWKISSDTAVPDAPNNTANLIQTPQTEAVITLDWAYGAGAGDRTVGILCAADAAANTFLVAQEIGNALGTLYWFDGTTVHVLQTWSDSGDIGPREIVLTINSPTSVSIVTPVGPYGPLAVTGGPIPGGNVYHGMFAQGGAPSPVSVSLFSIFETLS